MEIDSGDGLPAAPERTLQGSRHNNGNRGVDNAAATSGGNKKDGAGLPSEKSLRGLIDGLVGLAGPEEKGVAQALAKELHHACQKLRAAAATAGKATETSAGFPSLQSLRKVIAEEVKAAVAGTRSAPAAAAAVPAATTWAAVAGQPAVPKKVVPARLSREVLVKARETTPDLAKRTPQEIVQAVNAVSARKGAVAARKLPSGDVVVTFQDVAAKDWHTVPANQGWIQQAFGEQAKESTRTFAVLVKGISRGDLQEVTEEAFGKEIGIKGVEKVKFRVPRDQGLRWATALVTLDSQAAATKACDEGVIWKAQVFNCEPYSAALNPVQCYKCWKWGHIQHHCRKEALCPRCGTAAHGEGGRAGEDLCPTHRGHPFSCPTCGGRHPAWAGDCPAKTKEMGRAREAYQHRPRTFETSGQARQQQPPAISFGQLEEDDGFQVVGSRKRKAPRGRPTDLEKAARDPQQTRISLGPGPIFQATPPPPPPPQPVPETVVLPATQPATQSEAAEDQRMQGTNNEEEL